MSEIFQTESILSIVAAYLLGSLNFSILVSKFFLNDDIRRHGSGNAGATNTLRTHGKKITAVVAAGDILKGVSAVWIARLAAGEKAAWLCAFVCVLGHMFPVFFGFKGGKGVLTGVSVVCTLNFTVGILAFSLFLIIVIATKHVSSP